MVIPILLFLATLLIYRRTEKYDCLIDDREIAQRTVGYKPKSTFDFYWKHFRAQVLLDRKVAHGISIGVHALTTALVYTAFGSNNVSLLTALLYCFNPVNTQSTCWISGRGYEVSIMFLLLGLSFKHLFPLFYPLSLALGSINTVFAPLLFIFERPHWWLLLLPIVLIGAGDQIRAFKQRYKTTTPQMRKMTWKRGIIVAKTYGYYFWHCLFPTKVAMCPSYLHSYGIDDENTERWYQPDRWMILGIGLIVLSIAGFWIVPWKLFYGFMWFMLFTAQWSNLIYINHPISERYIILPLVGVMYMLANIISVCPFGTYLAIGFVVFYLTRLWSVMEQYKDIETFWRKNAEIFPDVGLSYNQWSISLNEAGKAGTAVDVMVEGLKTTPDDFRLNYNLANMMGCIGDPNLGLKYARQALKNVHKNSPDSIEMWKRHIETVIENCYKRGAKKDDVVIESSNNVSVSPAMENGR